MPERPAVDAATFARDVASGYTPMVLRGQVADWPVVAAAREGTRAVAAYLAGFGGGRPLETLVGDPAIGGRFFYTDDLAGFNFQRRQVPLTALLTELVRLEETGAEAPHALYANAAGAAEHLPGWADANPLSLPLFDAAPRLWIGNATQVATHYDMSTNLAAVAAGHRRFTLFPPGQIGNLYVGPLDRTPAGPPVSLVDPEAPDLVRFPRFAEAQRHALIAELAPGDAIFIPALWWHNVRAIDAFNVLVNYWWTVDAGPSPLAALVHAMLSVRDRPAAEKAAWRAWFDHYVFADTADEAGAHLPEDMRGPVGRGSAARTEQIRAFLAAGLTRG